MDSLSAKELKTKSSQELKGLLSQERSKLRDLRFKLSGAQVKNVQETKVVKKNVARILTVVSELKNSRV
ncbi:MAG: 50S ribosomal protein L29 [Parcubacteria group bacterium]|nr:50S ribosomal protein L29 [Parcubacteria group bacterium]